MREAATNRATVAHGAICNSSRDEFEQAMRDIGNPAVFDICMGHTRSDIDIVELFRCGTQLADRTDIDQQFWLR